MRDLEGGRRRPGRAEAPRPRSGGRADTSMSSAAGTELRHGDRVVVLDDPLRPLPLTSEVASLLLLGALDRDLQIAKASGSEARRWRLTLGFTADGLVALQIRDGGGIELPAIYWSYAEFAAVCVAALREPE